jgi:hypothetical protein
MTGDPNLKQLPSVMSHSAVAIISFYVLIYY